MPEVDIDRLLQMLIKTFALKFIVEKGGNEVHLETAPGRFITLGREGGWQYE